MASSCEEETLTGCRILSSTQTGRAKACARRCARLIAQQKISSPLVRNDFCLQNGKGRTFDEEVGPDLQDYAAGLTPNTLLLLFVSTTGEGEHTDTIQQTWKQLRKKTLPNDLFRGVSVAVFCLGDRAYGPDQFCAAGRKLLVRLLQLGAALACDPGYGDDGTPNGGVWVDLDEWWDERLLPMLRRRSRTGASDVPAALPTVHAAPRPPHKVTTLDSYGEHDTGSSSSDDDGLSFRDFFRRQAPWSAYRYDECDLTRIDSVPTKEQRPPLTGRVVVNQRITAEDWEQNTRHIRLEVAAPGRDRGTSPALPPPTKESWDSASLPYRAGDVASILPSNDPVDVEAFLRVLPTNLRDMADKEIRIDYLRDDNEPDGSPTFFPGVAYPYWPEQCTLRSWLTHCADLHGLPEREDLRALSAYCSPDHPLSTDQRDKLISLSETTEAALYADYVLREKRNWVDVLYDFDSLRQEGSTLTIEALLGLLPPIRPRDFSIANSPTEECLLRSWGDDGTARKGFCLELCVAVVEGTTPLGRSYHGLCSHYLSKLQLGNAVRMWIRPGSFHGIPLKADVLRTNSPYEGKTPPVLFVGAGTGVAPLRGLIREREAVRSILKADNSDGNTASSSNDNLERDNVLVFGCRKKSADFYYEEEWKSLQNSGRLGLLTAFSRDQWHKIYVQQVLEKADKQNKFLARHVLEHGGPIYIAGGPLMARAVKETIEESLARELESGEKEVKGLLSKMQRLGHFSVEAWS